MIIKQIKYGSGVLFSKNRLTVTSDEGKSSVDLKLDEKIIKEISRKLDGFVINNLNDLENAFENIKGLNGDARKAIELVIFNSSQHGWKIIDKNSKQIPRPMCLIFKKGNGIKEVYVTSLNSSNFDGVANAAKEVTLLVEKKADKKNFNDEELLLFVKEVVDEVFKDLDFELRIGVKFDNYENGKYVYSDKVLNDDEQYEYVNKLIMAYGLIYIENPFFEDRLDFYKKLNNTFMHACMICMNSRINDYTQGVDKRAFNAAFLHYNNFKQFKADLDSLMRNKINIILDADVNLINFAVGFKLPIVKLIDASINDQFARKLFQIVAEMKPGKI